MQQNQVISQDQDEDNADEVTEPDVEPVDDDEVYEIQSLNSVNHLYAFPIGFASSLLGLLSNLSLEESILYSAILGWGSGGIAVLIRQCCPSFTTLSFAILSCVTAAGLSSLKVYFTPLQSSLLGLGVAVVLPTIAYGVQQRNHFMFWKSEASPSAAVQLSQIDEHRNGTPSSSNTATCLPLPAP